MQARITTNNVRGTATSAIWNVSVLDRETIFAPILISFSRSAAKLHCLTSQGRANRPNSTRPTTGAKAPWPAAG